jgi:hypothetical protein
MMMNRVYKIKGQMYLIIVRIYIGFIFFLTCLISDEN